MIKITISTALILLCSIAFSQTGKIVGKIISTTSGQGLSSATIILQENSKTSVADQNGSFSINNLAPGTYTLKFSNIGFNDKIVEEVIVKANEVTNITISLDERKTTDENVTIVSTRVRAAKESVASLLIAQKNSASVSDGISAESIRKTPDRSTSDVLKRVSGASIQDDRFAIIRGLNDRYNAAYINGAALPSSESDRKAFAFDIFPSSVLDNLVIYKTATPDLPAEFAGGIIMITTKSIPTQNFTSISVGGGYNTLLTGNTRYYSETKGKTDWLGLDDGTRGLPKGLPSVVDLRNASPDVRAALSKDLFGGNYKWGVKQGNTSPNFNFQISKGANITKKGNEFIGMLLSLAYNRNYSFVSGERNTYDYDMQDGSYLNQNNKYRDSIYNDEIVLAALANFSIKINNNNSISWKNNYSVNTDNKLIKRFGNQSFESSPDFYRSDVVRWFTSNQITSSQLGGDHLIIKKLKTKFNWIAAYSNVKRDIPNLSRTTEVGDLNNLSPDISNGAVNLFQGTGTMFWTSNDENIKSFKFDLIQPFKFMNNTQNFVKIGGGYQRRERDFKSRILGFVPYNSLTVRFDNSLRNLPINSIFLKENLGLKADGKGGFSINDGTDFTSDYTASSDLTHAYLMADQRFFKKLRMIYGVRVEKFNQKLNARFDFSRFLNIDQDVTDVLPSLNLVYVVTPKMNVRFSYSKTLNRPEFREFAPFIFYDYVSQYSYMGNDTLKRALINNFDFRYEFFPGKAQLFSISAFFKDFTNPVEIVSDPLISNFAIYSNALSAKLYGVEAEFRTLISTLFGINRENSLLSKFTLTANAALIESNVKLGGFQSYGPEYLVTDRALQGQSPYLVNGSIGYNDEKLGLSSTVSVNRVGDRVNIAGTVVTADIYEKARTIVDFQLTKSFMKNKLDLKFTIRDLIAQNIDYYFDLDKSKSYSEKDRFLSSTLAPRVISFTASFKF